MLTALDLLGTFVFALSGALKAVRHELDWLGVAVLAALTGVGGGIVRDLLLGDNPPAVFQDERFFVVCLIGAIVVIRAAPHVVARWNLVMVADAIGLGLFAALGAAKGISHGLGPIGILLMGTLTAVGGGVIRDILVGERPAVLYKDFYATAALAGAGVLIGLDAIGVSLSLQLVLAALACSALRFVALIRNLRLPRTSLPPHARH
ncbi:MAG: trimeric intracellular cation channel family protein [Bacteroidota bacterium]